MGFVKSVSLASVWWLFSSVAVAGLVGLFILSGEIEKLGYQRVLSSAATLSQAACSELSNKFALAEQAHIFKDERRAQFQAALLEIVLDHYDGVEGGFWSETAGFTAYAYPSYEGSGKKTDVPEAEKARLARISNQSVFQGKLTSDTLTGKREASLVSACPVSSTEAVWTLSRTPLAPISTYRNFNRKFWIVVGAISLLFAFSLLAFALWSKQTSRKSRSDAASLNRNDRLRQIGELASGVAHDLREPLAALRLKLENVSVDPAGRAVSALPVALGQIDRMDRMVEMILALTRPFQITKRPTNLKSWFDDNFETVRAASREKNVGIEFRSSVESWSFDPFQLARALSNLIENAVAFSPAETVVTIDASAVQGKLVIEIRDRGPGVSPSLKEGESKRPGGTGLGLRLAKEIVEAHGGHLELVEGDHRGAWFKMEIPSNG